MEFNSPVDYLHYVQKEFAKSYESGTAVAEFEKITNGQLAKHDLSIEKLGEFGGLHLSIENLVKGIFSSLDKVQLKSIKENIAIGLLPSGVVEAYII